MIYKNTDEIFEALATTRRRISEQVKNVSDKAAYSRPAPDSWSAAEIVEHLSTTEQRFVQLISSLLAKGGAAGSWNSRISIQLMTDRANEKFEAPATLKPTVSLPLS